MQQTPEHRLLLWLAAATAVSVFALDSLVELGVAAAVPYVAVVWLAFLAGSQRGVWLAAGLCSLLTLLGFGLSPGDGGSAWLGYANRGLALVALWATALFCRQSLGGRQRLAAAELRTRRILDGALDAVVTIDLRGAVTEWNPQAERVFGWSREEALGRPLAELIIPPRYRRAHVWGLEQLRESGRGPVLNQRLELSALRRSGEEFPIELSVSPVKLEEGHQFSAFVRDLSERKRAEVERLRLAALVESSDDAIIGLTLEGVVTSWNPAAERLYGYTAAEFIGQPVAGLVPRESPDELPEILAQLGRGEKVDHFETVRVRKDGTPLHVSLTISPITGAGGQVVGASTIARDVTARKVLEEAQRRLNEELESRVEERTVELQLARDAARAASRAKSEFLANMSHEIRTPLNAVIGLTELVLRTRLDEEQRDLLDTVMGSGEALLAVLNDILDFSKVEAGKLVLEEMDFDLHDTVERTLRALAPRAEQKGLELLCFIAPELPAVFSGDPGRLRQVISNLVQNAIKFTESGEIVVRIEPEALEEKTALLYVSVTDTGLGIEAEQLDRLFQAFEQADSSTTRRFGGSGLGLAICRQLVELMGGRIGAESTPGEGSTFHFTARFGLEKNSLRNAEVAHAPVDGTRVLIVTESSTSRDILDRVTGARGMRTVLAASAERGLALLEKCADEADPVRVLLSDVQMNGDDGLGFVEMIRGDARFDDLAILLLTASGDVDRERLEALRVTGRLVKPLRQVELDEAIDRALGLEPVAPAQVPLPGAESEAALPPLRILLVDDSGANRKVAQALLAGGGHEITTAENGRQALERIEAGEFDVVLMDIQMPVMDGFTATSAIRAGWDLSRPHLPIVAMTAHALQGDRERCLAAGMDDYVSKPVRRRDLLEVLKRVTGARRP